MAEFDVERKIAFLLELEKLKAVLRKTKPVGLERYENSAEHSWQTALTALVFLEETDLDVLRVLKMLLIHDVVEIDCGDVFVYDAAARAAVAQKEQEAAVRIFGMLPDKLGGELLLLWQEFEAAQTPEARFAKAIDRVNPVLQNLASAGQSWVENGVTRQKVIAMNQQIENASPALWRVLKQQLIEADYLTDE